MSVDASLTRQELLLQAGQRLRGKARRERRWTKVALWTGIAIVVVLFAVSAARPLLGLPGPNEQNLSETLQAPSPSHPFGTDDLGRDVLSRTLAATPIDMQIALITTYVPLVIGIILGTIAGYFGRWIDSVLMRLVDLVLAFPFIVLVMAIVAIFGPGLTGVYVGLIVVGWALYARLARGEMLVLREQEFVMAAETLGLPTWRILYRHALPNVIRPSLVFSMADLVLNIIFVASLSYLGLGVQPPTAEWGAIMADGQDFLLNAWWITTLPGLVVVMVGLAFSLIGDALADLSDRDLRIAG